MSIILFFVLAISLKFVHVTMKVIDFVIFLVRGLMEGGKFFLQLIHFFSKPINLMQDIKIIFSKWLVVFFGVLLVLYFLIIFFWLFSKRKCQYYN